MLIYQVLLGCYIVCRCWRVILCQLIQEWLIFFTAWRQSLRRNFDAVGRVGRVRLTSDTTCTVWTLCARTASQPNFMAANRWWRRLAQVFKKWASIFCWSANFFTPEQTISWVFFPPGNVFREIVQRAASFFRGRRFNWGLQVKAQYIQPAGSSY